MIRKIDLIRELTKERKKLKKECGTVRTGHFFDCVFRTIIRYLFDGERIAIREFGSFQIVQSKVTKVYDFKLHKKVPFSGKKLIKFKTSGALDRALNGRPRLIYKKKEN